jgi:hypothetical protein
MDWSTILPAIIGMAIPFLLPLFPGLGAILKIIPKPVWGALLKAVDPGATITWSVPVAARRSELEARRTALLARLTFGEGGGDGTVAALDNVNRELAALPAGGILDTLKQNPLLILAIVGGVIFFVTQKGGCTKPAPAAPVKAAPEVSIANPFDGRSLQRNS